MAESPTLPSIAEHLERLERDLLHAAEHAADVPELSRLLKAGLSDLFWRLMQARRAGASGELFTLVEALEPQDPPVLVPGPDVDRLAAAGRDLCHALALSGTVGGIEIPTDFTIPQWDVVEHKHQRRRDERADGSTHWMIGHFNDIGVEWSAADPLATWQRRARDVALLCNVLCQYLQPVSPGDVKPTPDELWVARAIVDAPTAMTIDSLDALRTDDWPGTRPAKRTIARVVPNMLKKGWLSRPEGKKRGLVPNDMTRKLLPAYD